MPPLGLKSRLRFFQKYFTIPSTQSKQCILNYANCKLRSPRPSLGRSLPTAPPLLTPPPTPPLQATPPFREGFYPFSFSFPKPPKSCVTHRAVGQAARFQERGQQRRAALSPTALPTTHSQAHSADAGLQTASPVVPVRL